MRGFYHGGRGEHGGKSPLSICGEFFTVLSASSVVESFSFPPDRLGRVGGLFLEGYQICDEVREVALAQAFGQAVGHEGDVARLPLVDVGFADRDLLGVGVLELDRVAGVALEDA